ncbi:transposase isoform B [Chlorella sorokiniana]|uniref:Transposase isoform B n=1 Tax=Chlorella sorokiniana TaxID=3076 RepID=A0A2P6TDR6_CHLSO|nr:transposase isoform B [Chlorella sorokiniana]|eukprot:PRW20772.1 transposase isoform B [Chlorella sorokiniana]
MADAHVADVMEARDQLASRLNVLAGLEQQQQPNDPDLLDARRVVAGCYKRMLSALVAGCDASAAAFDQDGAALLALGVSYSAKPKHAVHRASSCRRDDVVDQLLPPPVWQGRSGQVEVRGIAQRDAVHCLFGQAARIAFGVRVDSSKYAKMKALARHPKADEEMQLHKLLTKCTQAGVSIFGAWRRLRRPQAEEGEQGEQEVEEGPIYLVLPTESDLCAQLHTIAPILQLLWECRRVRLADSEIRYKGLRAQAVLGMPVLIALGLQEAARRRGEQLHEVLSLAAHISMAFFVPQYDRELVHSGELHGRVDDAVLTVEAQGKRESERALRRQVEESKRKGWGGYAACPAPAIDWHHVDAGQV